MKKSEASPPAISVLNAPPPGLGARYEELRNSLHQLAKEPEQDLGTTLLALDDVIHFLAADEQLYQEEAVAPLYKLFNAVMDTLQGARPEFLRPWTRSKSRPESMAFPALQGEIGALAESLVKQTEMSPTEVVNRIERELWAFQIKFPNGEPITSKEVKAWRYNGADYGAVAAQNSFKKTLKILRANPVKSKADALKRIKQMAVRLRRQGF